MSLASPRLETAGQLVYFQDGEANESTLDSDAPKELLIESSDAGGFKGESMYVTLFEEMVKVVLETEEYLFDTAEVACFERYKKLSYRARYLFIRLCLRKNDRWIRLGDLKYQRELGNNILAAMHELCSFSNQPSIASTSTPSTNTEHSGKMKTEERDDIIDLTLDEDEEDVKPDISKLAKEEEEVDPLPLGTQHEPDYTVFADDESRATVRDLLECLRVDELREIVKEMKVPKTENKRDSLINALLHITSGQSTLSFPVVSTSSAKGTGNGTGKRLKKKFAQASLTAYMPGRKTQTQKDRLRAVVTQRIGACIKLNPDVVRLFRRVNVVYFRSTIYTPTLLTNAILARCKKRTFEPVPYTRSTRIWLSREALLQYEEALEWEAQVDDILGTTTTTSSSSSSRSRSVASRTPAPRFRSTGSKSPSKREGGGTNVGGGGEEEGGVEDTPRMRDAREVKAIFERVYPLWKEVVAVKGEEEGRGQGLERFHHGHVLTRIICKGASALGTLHEHTREFSLLGELLAQRRWRRGRRGRWYERRALILMTHCEKGEENWREAWRVVVGALEDEDTHIVYRPKLLRRLKTLEKRLGVPEEERVQCLGGLNQAEQEVIMGVRVYPAVDASGRLGVAESNALLTVDSKSNVKQSKLPFTQAVAGDGNDGTKVQLPWTGKSVWKGRDGEEVNVETFALQHYETLGYKGFHSEGRIVTTIFGLLFWDIIFAPIPGAFETAYQLAPLDITEETFYTARQDLMQARLDTIRGGRAVEILAATYDHYSAEKRGCVGVRWDLFGREDLVEIVECFEPAGLAAICQTVAEDYGNRTSGVPDLIIWNRETKTCKFVEVKGPGDNLQENQKVWIDVLLQAGIPVEVCRVAEEGEDGSPKKSKAKSKSKVKKEKLEKEEPAEPSTAKKRKRKVEEEEENTPESEDEVDYSLLDPSQDVDADTLPPPIVKPEFPGVGLRSQQQVEVLITTPSPRKRRRVNAD